MILVDITVLFEFFLPEFNAAFQIFKIVKFFRFVFVYEIAQISSNLNLYTVMQNY